MDADAAAAAPRTRLRMLGASEEVVAAKVRALVDEEEVEVLRTMGGW